MCRAALWRPSATSAKVRVFPRLRGAARRFREIFEAARIYGSSSDFSRGRFKLPGAEEKKHGTIWRENYTGGISNLGKFHFTIGAADGLLWTRAAYLSDLRDFSTRSGTRVPWGSVLVLGDAARSFERLDRDRCLKPKNRSRRFMQACWDFDDSLDRKIS